MSLVPGSEPADLGAVTPVATQTDTPGRSRGGGAGGSHRRAARGGRLEVAAKLAAMGGSRSVASII